MDGAKPCKAWPDRPSGREWSKRRNIQTPTLVLPKKPLNLAFALETWLEGNHQH